MRSPPRMRLKIGRRTRIELQGAVVGETSVDEIDGAQLGDRVVGVADDHLAGESLGQVAKDEDERERIGLVAGDVDEGRGGEVAALGMLADVLRDHLLEEELTEEVGGVRVGEPGHLVAPFPARDELGEALVEGVPVLGRDVMEPNVDDAGHAVNCTGGLNSANAPSDLTVPAVTLRPGSPR